MKSRRKKISVSGYSYYRLFPGRSRRAKIVVAPYFYYKEIVHEVPTSIVKTWRDPDLKRGDFRVFGVNVSKAKNIATKAVLASNSADKVLDTLQKRGEPRRAIVILSVKVPGERKPKLISQMSGVDKVVNKKFTKKFMETAVKDYYKQAGKKLRKGQKDKKYDKQAQVYEVTEVAVRYLFEHEYDREKGAKEREDLRWIRKELKESNIQDFINPKKKRK